MKFIPALGAISGNIGSAMFSHNRAGSYVRHSRKPTKANSNAAFTSKQNFKKNAILWEKLDPDTKQVFERIAVQYKIPSGFALFIQRSMNCTEAYGTPSVPSNPYDAPLTPQFTEIPAAVPISTLFPNVNMGIVFGVGTCPANAAIQVLVNAMPTRTDPAFIVAKASTIPKNLIVLKTYHPTEFMINPDIIALITERQGTVQLGSKFTILFQIINPQSGIKAPPFVFYTFKYV